MRFFLDAEIGHWLARYVAGEISLQTFQEWFVPIAWGVHESTNPAAQSLANNIELLLAEFSSGDWTEEELREKLGALVRAAPELVIRTESSSSVSAPPIIYRTPLVGRPISVGSA